MTREALPSSKWLWKDNLIILEVWRCTKFVLPVVEGTGEVKRGEAKWREGTIVEQEPESRQFGSSKTNNPIRLTFSRLPQTSRLVLSPHTMVFNSYSPKCFTTSSRAAAAGAQRPSVSVQRSWIHECVPAEATECSIVAASFIVSTDSGVRADQETSHPTSVRGFVNAFSSALRITSRPSTRRSPTPGGSQPHLKGGVKGQDRPLVRRRIAFPNSVGELTRLERKPVGRRAESHWGSVSQVFPGWMWLTPPPRSKDTFSPAALFSSAPEWLQCNCLITWNCCLFVQWECASERPCQGVFQHRCVSPVQPPLPLLGRSDGDYVVTCRFVVLRIFSSLEFLNRKLLVAAKAAEPFMFNEYLCWYRMFGHVLIGMIDGIMFMYLLYSSRRYNVFLGALAAACSGWFTVQLIDWLLVCSNNDQQTTSI